MNFKITKKPASYFLEVEIHCLDDRDINIGQEVYATKILQRFRIDCKSVNTLVFKEKGVCVEVDKRDFLIVKYFEH